MDCSDIETLQIRALQAMYADAHHALTHWGAWSRDTRRIFPCQKGPGIWSQAKQSEFDDFAEEGEEGLGVVEQAEVKPERAEEEPYDERLALDLDQRIHGAGGLPDYIRLAIRTAYFTREVPESQFARLSGCTPHAFRERLEEGLKFVARWV